jgi:hypothetical protein
VESLKNYALPDFILSLVAKECDSDLAKRGRTDKKLHSMNEESLELLYRVFVKCDKNKSGQYARYRFYAYVASMYYKCEVLINEILPGKDTAKFYHMVDDIKNGEQGTMLTDAIYASSVGFKRESLIEIERLSVARNNDDPENKLNFKTAYFENDIYSTAQC